MMKELIRAYAAFVGVNLDAREKNIQSLRGQINIYSDAVDQRSSEIKVPIKDIEDASQELGHTISARRIEEQQLDLDFDHIIGHHDVESINISNDILIVVTKKISILYGGKIYPIGRFQIEVHPLSFRDHWDRKAYVKFFNLDGTRDITIDDRESTFHHPHVFAYGHPCLGNILNTVTNLVKTRKYPALISTCIEYLKSYRENDTGAAHPKWWLTS